MPAIKWIAIAAILPFLHDGLSESAARTRILPEPNVEGGPSLASVLAARRSRRELGARQLSEAEVGQLLWAAQGINDGHRTAPSAGALYPLTVRVADVHGVWRYAPADHALVHENAADVRRDLAAAAYYQRHVGDASVVIVVTAEIAITARKYGPRAERFAALEAGHVAQNVLLQATALHLGAVPVGAFDDDRVRDTLDLEADITPLYLIPIGAMQ